MLDRGLAAEKAAARPTAGKWLNQEVQQAMITRLLAQSQLWLQSDRHMSVVTVPSKEHQTRSHALAPRQEDLRQGPHQKKDCHPELQRTGLAGGPSWALVSWPWRSIKARGSFEGSTFPTFRPPPRRQRICASVPTTRLTAWGRKGNCCQRESPKLILQLGAKPTRKGWRDFARPIAVNRRQGAAKQGGVGPGCGPRAHECLVHFGL